MRGEEGLWDGKVKQDAQTFKYMSEATINTSFPFVSFFFIFLGGVKTEIGWKTPMRNALNKPYMDLEGNETTRNTSIDG